MWDEIAGQPLKYNGGQPNHLSSLPHQFNETGIHCARNCPRAACCWPVQRATYATRRQQRLLQEDFSARASRHSAACPSLLQQSLAAGIGSPHRSPVRLQQLFRLLLVGVLAMPATMMPATTTPATKTKTMTTTGVTIGTPASSQPKYACVASSAQAWSLVRKQVTRAHAACTHALTHARVLSCYFFWRCVSRLFVRVFAARFYYVCSDRPSTSL